MREQRSRQAKKVSKLDDVKKVRQGSSVKDRPSRIIRQGLAPIKTIIASLKRGLGVTGQNYQIRHRPSTDTFKDLPPVKTVYWVYRRLGVTSRNYIDRAPTWLAGKASNTANAPSVNPPGE